MYYVMTCDDLFPRTTIGEQPELPRGPWKTGRKIDYPVEVPVRYELDPDYPGVMLPMYKANAPLFREDLLKALAEAGVDNLEIFDAVLRDPRTGKDYEDYKAVNVVGLVAAADSRSEVAEGWEAGLIDTLFETLVFDEAAPGELLLFRLAESVSAIVVHEKVKQRVETAEIPGMTFHPSGEWSG
ncbi:MAG TPA: hypothetical protein VFR81_29995 [Longimicrobium sp.]|nr:hypothetical protein [Longimicrobium sp.]